MDNERLIEEIPLGRPCYVDFHPREKRGFWYYILVVKEYERSVTFRLGIVTKRGARGPGIYFYLPCTDSFINIDIRTTSLDVEPQKVLSKDSVTLKVDAVVNYRITDAAHVIASVSDHNKYVRLLAATTLRTVLGTKDLSEILSESEHINQIIQSSMDARTMLWGMKIERVEVMDIVLPKVMQRPMAVTAEAYREARAKVIVAEGVHQASRLLTEASEIMAQSAGASDLHFVHALKSVASEQDSKLIVNLQMAKTRRDDAVWNAH